MGFRPGETFGRYQLTELLGRGGMGEVYRAYDTLLHRSVALKVLTVPAASPGGTADEEKSVVSTGGAERILREARAAAGIEHPNAIAIYDVGEFEGISFLAMELVTGRTLRAFVGDASVPVSQRLRWLVDVARALSAAHDLGLVHRDIKPENVMVGEDGFVKVLDFGIARRNVPSEEAAPTVAPADPAGLARLAQSAGTLTADGVVLGTPMYMAPEQLLGGAVDRRTDQFAWGVVAYELVSGRLPWDGDWVKMLSQILSRDPPPMGEVQGASPRVEEVIRRALQKAPAGRFATMKELADELEPFAITTGRQARVTVGTREGGAEAVIESGRTWALRAVAFVVVVAVACFVVLGRGLIGHPAAKDTAAADAAPPEVPSAMSTNEEATAAYRAGLQALRDGSLGAAVRQFQRAVDLDPLFGAAQLRRGLMNVLEPRAPRLTGANPNLQGAHAAQASLGTRDRILLDAFERFARDPQDLEGARQLLASATDHFSGGEFPFELAIVLATMEKPREALDVIATSIARDPTFASSWRWKGLLFIALGDQGAAADALAQCLRLSPGATTCLADMAHVQASDGKCEELVGTSRQLLSLMPNLASLYDLLAQGLVGSGQPIDAVRAALKQSWERSDSASRPFLQAFAEADLAILSGDFARAEEQFQQAERLAASDPNDSAHFDVAYPHTLFELEAGREAEGLRIANRYLRARSGFVTGLDFTVFMQTAEVALGGMTRDAFDDARKKWLADPSADLSAPQRWTLAYALTASTRDDALAAVALQPDASPFLTAFGRTPDYAEPVGRTLALAGRADEALSYLALAANSCVVLDPKQALFSTWGAFDLGQVLEARADVTAACAAYAKVVHRWGRASGSRTAEKAAARRRALDCSP